MTVLDILAKTKKPICASVLVNKLKVNKTTIYRQIKKYIKANLILEVEFGDGKKRYELKGLKHHHHLMCRHCNKIENISLDEKVLLSEVAKRSNFRVEKHNLEFFGLCKNCK